MNLNPSDTVGTVRTILKPVRNLLANFFEWLTNKRTFISKCIENGEMRLKRFHNYFIC